MTQKQESTKPLPNEEELRKQIADAFVEAHTLGHWTCIEECLDHKNSPTPINQVMHLFREYAKEYALDRVIEENELWHLRANSIKSKSIIAVSFLDRNAGLRDENPGFEEYYFKKEREQRSKLEGE